VFVRVLSLLCLSCVACAHGRVPDRSAPRRPTRLAQASALFDQGRALAELGDLTRAEQYLATALHEGHDPDLTLRVLLSVCIRSSRLRSALSYAAPHLMAHPSNVRLRQLVASILLALGERKVAEDALRQVIRSDPNAAQAEFLLATLLQQHAERQREAAEHFARYVALVPMGPHAEEARAMLAAGLGADAQLD